MNKAIAAIDAGTNSFHMVVVRPEEAVPKFRVLEHVRENVRIGAGSAGMKTITAAAISRAAAALLKFKKIAESHNADIRAIGTSAVREARNSPHFIEEIENKTGVTIETVSEFEEARLIYLGVLQSLPIYNKRALLLHIGGGSTEILAGYRKQVLYSNGLKLGALRLTERFFPSGVYNASSIKACREYVAGMLGPVRRAVLACNYETVIGSSGTILAIGRLAVSGALNFSSTKSLQGVCLSKNDMLNAIETITDAALSRRLDKIITADSQRADIITAGALILEHLLRVFPVPEFVFSEGSLREGIILDTIEKRFRLRTHHHLDNLRSHTVQHLAAAFSAEKSHSSRSAFLSLRLFDDLRRLHCLGEDKRELLAFAAQLHDIGLFVSHAHHHRHSYYLIRNAELLGFTENEKALMATIARYHRKSHPKQKHDGFGEFSPADQKTVLLLSSLLRVADALDRSHRSMVRDLRCSIRNREIVCTITARPGGNLDLELWGAEWKKGLFEEVYGKRLIFKVR